MTADKTREAIQPRLRAGWTQWLVLRALRLRGWRVRGKFPKPFWRTLVVMHAPQPWQVLLAKWLYPVESIRVDRHYDELSLMEAWSAGKCVVFQTDGSPTQMGQAQAWAKACGARVTLCAWESERRFLHVHAPFKPSKHAERDVHYMSRYFKYFLNKGFDYE